jgi:crossover junction endodeoxyribonuclease RuvC
MSSSIRILGIDPGSQITGYGIVDSGSRVAKAVTWGTVKTSGDHATRLREIFTAFETIVGEYLPDEIAIERVFVHRNADSALKLGQARAAALCGTFARTAHIHEYSPRHIKKAVVGTGGAGKEQVQQMIGMLLGIRGALQADAADALAVAVCHANSRTTSAIMLAAART